MEGYHGLTSKERARIADIQDSLIELYVEQKEALDKGKKARAIEIGFEIKNFDVKWKQLKSARMSDLARGSP